jgi:hypothetical protein
MPKRKLSFLDTEEAAELFVWFWTAYAGSDAATADDEELRRAMRLKDMRDEISVERTVPGRADTFRALKRDEGPQSMVMTEAEYGLLKRAIKSFRWPLINADAGREVREFIDNAEEISEEPVDGG